MTHLRPVEIKDLEQLRSWRNRPEIHTWCRQSRLISQDCQSAWFEIQGSDPSMEMFVIEDNLPRGVCGLTSIDHLTRRAEFSLYIGPEHHGYGYGRTGLEMLLRHGFNDLNLNLIWGETFDGNPAAKMFEKIGFVHEGTRRQFYFKNGKYIAAHLYSMLAEEWHYA